MHQKHLLRFIKSKLKKEPDEVKRQCPGPSVTFTFTSLCRFLSLCFRFRL